MLRALPGDLTDCHHCRAILEYVEDSAGLSLRLAPEHRVQELNRAAREMPREPTLSQIVDFIRKNRQMPVRSVVEHLKLQGKSDPPPPGPKSNS